MSIEKELQKLKKPLRNLGLYRMDNSTLLNCELSAYAVGFDIVNNNLARTEKEMFIATSEDYGIKNREDLFKRRMEGANLEERRNMLDYELSVTSNDFNLDGIKKAVHSCAIVCDIFEFIIQKFLFFDCHEVTDSQLTKEKAVSLAQKFMPAHIETVFDFRTVNWNKLDQRDLTFNQLDSLNMSWNDIDEYDI